MADLLEAEALPAETCRNCESPAASECRICHAPFCRTCFTDHHHEGYGTPAASH